MALRTVGAATAALALLALAGCSSGNEGTPAATSESTSRIPVITSTNVYGSIAQAIGGDRVSVQPIINDPEADPHSYESTPADAAKVADARIVVYNGGGYDDFFPRLVQSGGGHPTVLDVAQISGLVPPGESTDEPGSTSDDDHGHESFNEHFWYDLPTVEKVADQLASDLAAADPAGADQYTANAKAFKAKVDELITKAKAIGTAHPGARLAVTEPVPDYLIRTAGLTDVTPTDFTEAIEEDTDPPAAVLQQTLALFQGDPVKALVLNAQTETPTTDQVEKAAQTAGVPVVDVTETLPAGVNDYVSWMGGQIDALAGALNRS